MIQTWSPRIRARLWPFLVGFAATIAYLLIYTWSVVDTSAAPAHPRTHTWTFVANEFEPDGVAYLSPVERSSFTFTAAGVYVKPSGITSILPTIELRLKADGGDWSPWYLIEELETEADGYLYGENLVAWPQARELQVRIRTVEPPSDTIRDLTVIAIDTQEGPTEAQAALAARARTTALAPSIPNTPGVPQPVVISREEWGANESWMTWSPYYEPVEKVMIHHTVSGGGADPAAEVRAIYYYHAITRDWGDIGYNYLVDRLGNIYEGRYGGTDVIGAHVAYWNEGSMGVSVLGCYDGGACSTSHMPTAATLEALTDLTAWVSSRRAIDPRELKVFSNGYSTVSNYVLSGHRDYGSTVCPGGALYAEIPSLRQMAWEGLPEYDVRFDWHDTPLSLDAGRQLNIYLNLYNRGRLVWSDNAGVRLGYRWLKNEQVLEENTAAARIISDAVVNFGEMTALVAQLKAPSTAGVLTLRWDLYRDGVGWFSDQPTPNGRSQPLDLVVEVNSLLLMDVQMYPSFVTAGAPLHLDITMQGVIGQAFETRTFLPPEVRYVVGSGESDSGTLRFGLDSVTWTGTLEFTTTQASFDMLVSSELDAPRALAATTVFTIPGHSPLTITRRFVVNGYRSFIPFIVRE